MSRWFRHYAGMARDDKLVRAALRSGQSVERVVWVWAAILESAAEIDDHGRYELDCAEVAYFLRADEADIGRIVECLEGLGRLHTGSVAKWGDRQFQSDRSAERQKRYRDKRASRDSDAVHSSSDAGVTPASRHGDAPETETETDIPVANATGPAEQSEKPSLSPADQLWTDGVATLETMHVAPPKARSMIGKWLKDTGGDAGRVHWAIGEASLHGSGDPIPYVTRVLSDRSTQRAPPHRQAKRNTGLDGLDELERRYSHGQQTTLRIAG